MRVCDRDWQWDLQGGVGSVSPETAWWAVCHQNGGEREEKLDRLGSIRTGRMETHKLRSQWLVTVPQRWYHLKRSLRGFRSIFQEG